MIQETSTQPLGHMVLQTSSVQPSCPFHPSPPSSPSLLYKPIYNVTLFLPHTQVTELEWPVEMIQETSTQPLLRGVANL